MPDISQKHDEDPPQSARQQHEQATTNTQGLDRTQEAANDTRPLQQEQQQQVAQTDAAEMQQRWPELNAADERQLKEAFEKFSDQAEALRTNIDGLLAESPNVTRELAETAREFVDRAMEGARQDVNAARESGGQDLGQTLQRLEDRTRELADAQVRLDQDERASPATRSRQTILEDAGRSMDDVKQQLSEMTGQELERREMAWFRKEASLPDEALVKRPDDGDLFASNLSMKRVMDEIEDFAQVERRDRQQDQSVTPVNQRASTEDQWQDARRIDEAMSAERWQDLTPAAEQKLKDAFRDVGEQADSIRGAIRDVIEEQGASPRLDDLQVQVDKEMEAARKSVADVLQNADADNRQVPRESLRQLEQSADRLERLERELDQVAGEKVRDVLEPSGLTDALEHYRELLAAEVEQKKAQAEQAHTNRDVNPGGHDLARQELRAATEQLRELDQLLDRRIDGMRPDLVEVKLREQQGEEQLRIEMTDITHRVDSINHTAKAFAYREAMQQAFPDAEVNMFEYRSPTQNNMLGEAAEFAEALEREVRKREAAIEERRRGNGD